ncbi:hypothetical protein P43SY_004494 [Pythium insidiosum]|uniref:phosphatidylinositol-3,5-bisphosphate 3-phosphatase n=1 Tax=Pythium insidiosum TaxID=114742 RepID=A0AAD5L864_PYTIN|nr:hypothetical protein P43SY_004494 [Pythium insidiosum]
MLFKVVRAESLPASDMNGTSDPFARVLYDGKEVGVTPRVKRCLNPRWDHELPVSLVHAGPMYVEVEVWDKDELSSNDLLGSLRVPFPDWRAHVDEYQRRVQRWEAARRQPPAYDDTASTSSSITSPTFSRSASARSVGGPETHRRSRSLHALGCSTPGRGSFLGGSSSMGAGRRLLDEGGRSSTSSATSTTPTTASQSPAMRGTSTPTGLMDAIAPAFVWCSLVKGPVATGRVLCAVQYEERDLKFLANQPYGTSIYDVFLPQHPRFKQAYHHLPRSWHPDPNVRSQELSAMHAGTPKDSLFPWQERLLHMVEEVTVTFHVNESNQGVLATLVLTNYRLWVVPYRRVKGLLHEDVHTIPIGKILRASISQRKRGSNVNTITVLELENMDAGHYHVTLSPISRLRDSVRDFTRDAEAKRIKQLHNMVAEIEWLKTENTFCAPFDLNHQWLGASESAGDAASPDKASASLSPSALTSPSPSPPPPLARAATMFRTDCAPPSPPPEQPPPLRHHVSASAASLKAACEAPSGGKASQPQAAPAKKPATAAAAAAASLRGRIRYDPEREFKRQGALGHPRWRRCFSNESYELCASYPSFLVVPASLSDETIKEASRFRSKNRFPALTWVHPRTGAPLCRSSQPNTGVLRSTNTSDRDLIWAIRDAAIARETACRSPGTLPKKSSVVHIVDARPEINAKSNALAGKGHESVKQYDRDGVPTASITFMGIDNIHAVRSAFAGLTQALYEVEDSNFFGAVQKSHWLEYVCAVLQGASEVASHLERGDAVLVHCSDGWDRTAQLAALAQLMLDPYFRTLEGFAVLIEKDWCAFGHMFKKRCGHPTSDQTSPIFQQFLDAVYQLLLQFPTHFQFNELLLSSIAEAVYSSWYGTFQMNSERERRAFLADVPSASVWDVIRASTDRFLNPLFQGESDGARLEPMLPVCRVRVMQLWSGQYQKAISHMRLQQREYEMLQLIRQQETELSRLYAVLSGSQRMELRAVQLRSDIARLARSMNLEYPERDDGGAAERVPSSSPGLGHPRGRGRALGNGVGVGVGPADGVGKRSAAASVDFHDLETMAAVIDASTSDEWAAGAQQQQQQQQQQANGRRKSITSRSRSNSLRLKQSLLSMMGHLGGNGTTTSTSSSTTSASHEPTAAQQRPATTPALRSPSGRHSLQSPTGSHHRHQHADELKRELHHLESQLAKLHNQVARKEETAQQLLRRFRCYNYNLPESALAAEPDAALSPARRQRRHHSGSSARGAFSPSSSSSRDSPSPSRRAAPNGGGHPPRSPPGAMAGRSASSSSDAANGGAFTPGSAPLLTDCKVISSGEGFRNAQPVWERDADAPCCKRCKKKFKTFYRNRHHCRCCGYVFCGRCTSNRMNLPEFGYYDVVRVCATCYNSGEDG